MADEQQGTVKVWNAGRGFGFATREGQDDIFVHVSELQNTQALAVGDKISFEEGKDPISGRLRAIRVKVED